MREEKKIIKIIVNHWGYFPLYHTLILVPRYRYLCLLGKFCVNRNVSFSWGHLGYISFYLQNRKMKIEYIHFHLVHCLNIPAPSITWFPKFIRSLKLTLAYAGSNSFSDELLKPTLNNKLFQSFILWCVMYPVGTHSGPAFIMLLNSESYCQVENM